ncbi:hypothetical protein ACN4EK_24445 [Pantanalinema rosaneae CENA516]|uniref:hypothetical protein n=1 Tax=Pantanalinema rosaneae TaxID=1620701 RepID=UPI003D6E32C6
MQAKTEHLSPAAAHALLDTLPEKIRRALITYAEEIDYPVEAVVEIAIASFLDPDSLSFVDCQPMTAMQRKAG